MPKETGKTLCEMRGSIRGNGWKRGELPFMGISLTFGHQFSSCFIYRQNNPHKKASEILPLHSDIIVVLSNK